MKIASAISVLSFTSMIIATGCGKNAPDPVPIPDPPVSPVISQTIKLLDRDGASSSVQIYYSFENGVLKGKLVRLIDDAHCEYSNFEISERTPPSNVDFDYSNWGSAAHVAENPRISIPSTWISANNCNAIGETTEPIEVVADDKFKLLFKDSDWSQFDPYESAGLEKIIPRSSYIGAATAWIDVSKSRNLFRLVVTTEVPARVIGIGLSSSLATLEVEALYVRQEDANAIEEARILGETMKHWWQAAFVFYKTHDVRRTPEEPNYGYAAAREFMSEQVQRLSKSGDTHK